MTREERRDVTIFTNMIKVHWKAVVETHHPEDKRNIDNDPEKKFHDAVTTWNERNAELDSDGLDGNED